ncbi:hypothetical protein KZ829_15470 [Actinoplanes hulinensis]|uniref:Uncharacterized protein n=1 Tax=Actinoplanes hulinensis TaxID=1144547 RepID=A0ABS7B2V5_9ACTN|nr:hypothetical protein [Actinoplanes hulinensis]MBW6435139.1 hypothetical protein [Actinoplanes hulinensis]
MAQLTAALRARVEAARAGDPAPVLDGTAAAAAARLDELLRAMAHDVPSSCSPSASAWSGTWRRKTTRGR